ncbi:efflux RND transporter periplasmic adaptor subunit [Rhizosphaericola mali]|uniref:Efflux RND transporter periplasmic adaptor subunit n=2 Tax=Rhizosphaericola mali TaxID=2545455 RepID=A0A5P2G1F6_9BACT|nr:efflux RND transporter periplasmic adaptor subunit [Rhizosphaericola mali]
MDKMLYNFLKNTVLISATVFSLFSCKSKPKDKTADAPYTIPDSLLKTIDFDTAKMIQRMDAVTLTGMVDYNQDNVVRIYPQVSGNISNMRVMLGDYVKAGQVLGTIRSSDVADLNSSLINAQANLSLAKKSLDAAKSLFKSGLSSQTDLATAENNYQQAQSELNRVEQVLKINAVGGKTGDVSIIKAPISGFVVEKFVSNNTFIRSDNSNPLFTISDLKNVWVMANVYESSIQDVRKGDKAEVTTLAYPDRVFNGTISEVMNVLDPNSKVLKIKIVLPNTDYKLKPQMFTTVSVIQNEGGEALAIPSKSLVFDNSQYYVLIYKGKNDIKITPVSVGTTVGGYTYIKSGVQPGDVVIATQALLLYQELNG